MQRNHLRILLTVCFILFISIFISDSLFAKSDRALSGIEGRIVDRVTSRPVESATVRIVPSNRMAVSDIQGIFIISELAVNMPTKTIGKIILKKNQRKIAPPMAVDRLLNNVDKNNASAKKTKPIIIVANIKII